MPIGVEDVEGELAGLIEGQVSDEQIDVEVDVAEVQQAAARQPQIDAVVEHLVAAVRTAVIVHHEEIAFVDILGGEEEAVVVAPHGALDLAEIARHIDETAIAVGSRRATIGGLRVDLVAPRQRRAPAIVIERAREVVHVGGAIALGAVMRVVEVQLALVAAEAAIVLAIRRQTVVDADQEWFR